MEITLGEIYSFIEPLTGVSKLELPAAPSYHVAKLVRLVMAEAKLVEEQRQALIKKYGEKEAGGILTITPESKNWVPFVKELNELFTQKIDLDVRKVLLPIKNLNIQPATLLVLDKIIGLEGMEEEKEEHQEE